MKRLIITVASSLAVALIAGSCNAFLEENFKTALSPKYYFKTEQQIVAGVNGLYTFVDDLFEGDVEVGTQNFIFLDYLPGYAIRPRSAGSIYLSQAMSLTVSEENTVIEKLWRSAYTAIENCNGVIAGIESSGVTMDAVTKDKLLGEAYFMRAYHYFNLVRLWGEVPLKTTVTTDLSDVKIPLSSQEDIYGRIETDLVHAADLMAASPWTSTDGRVTRGAVYTLLAKVYLTMAGYPLQKGTEYYAKAYETAHEVYASGQFYLFPDYAALRDPANANAGEHIWMIQCEQQYAGSPVHNDMLPYPEPEKPISANSAFGGALAPAQAFYDSYTEGDLRTAEKGYYYSEHEATDGSGVVQLDRPYIYKYWDSNCASTGKSGMNYPLLRYADLLLVMAEAKAQADGGTTTDKDAVDAYWMVRGRALPEASKPGSVSFEEVYRERLWELCFESQTWFDLLRTRKILNVTTGAVIDLIGYEAPGHNEGCRFEEEDLLFPYPLREKRLNPNLIR